jgi:transposase-like protein
MYKVAITNIQTAFKEIKHFCPDEWEGDYRPYAREALKRIIEDRMERYRDAYLEELHRQDIVDRCNGYYTRHLLTELGDIELSIPRTRTFSAINILNLFARRTVNVDRMILLSFILGLSTRKVGSALLPVLGEPVSPQTVSRIAKQLDDAVISYHKRPLSDRYKALIIDGVVMKQKTGAGAQKRVILVALGIRDDNRKEIIDFCQVQGESQAAWEGFLNNLYNRGLKGENLKLIITDGGKGLQAALPLIYGQVPIQRCWAHKTRNILNYVKRAEQKAVKTDLHNISHAKNLVNAQQKARSFVKKWEGRYPDAVSCLTKDLIELLTFFKVDLDLKPSELRTTNAIERRFVEVRRRTRPMGVFSDRTSVDRILFAVFSHENKKEGVATLFPLTHNN